MVPVSVSWFGFSKTKKKVPLLDTIKKNVKNVLPFVIYDIFGFVFGKKKLDSVLEK